MGANMTCIVALIKDGDVYIGGDSAGTDSSFGQSIRADAKVFENGPFIMGFTSSFRMGQLLRFSLSVPEQTSKQEDYEFMCTTFIDAVRATLEEGGFLKVVNGVERGGVFVVGYNGAIYVIEGDLQVGIPTQPFTAVGSGAEVALGALEILTKMDNLSPKEMVTKALEASVAHNASVRPPFVILFDGINMEDK